MKIATPLTTSVTTCILAKMPSIQELKKVSYYALHFI